MSDQNTRQLHRVPRRGEMLDGFVSRSKVYTLLKEGKLQAVKHGRRSFITDESIRKFRDSLPNYLEARLQVAQGDRAALLPTDRGRILK